MISEFIFKEVAFKSQGKQLVHQNGMREGVEGGGG